MDSYQSVAIAIFAIDTVDYVNGLCDRLTGEFVAEYVDADFLGGIVECLYCLGNALDRTGITEYVPIAQVVHQYLAAAQSRAGDSGW